MSAYIDSPTCFRVFSTCYLTHFNQIYFFLDPYVIHGTSLSQICPCYLIALQTFSNSRAPLAWSSSFTIFACSSATMRIFDNTYVLENSLKWKTPIMVLYLHRNLAIFKSLLSTTSSLSVKIEASDNNGANSASFNNWICPDWFGLLNGSYISLMSSKMIGCSTKEK